MKKRLFGRHGGRAVEEIVLQSADAAVAVLNYGCVVRDWRVDADRRSVPVVLGFRQFGDYVANSRSHGIVAGRVANRTENARFELEGQVYDLTPNHGPHHLHGGAVGLGRRVWEMDGDGTAEAVELRYLSPDGEEGYPGTVEFSVTFRLEGPRLCCEMRGQPDRPTPINLAQHNYYNLAGDGDVRDHVVWIDAPDYTPVRADLIPDGSIDAVQGTRMNFTTPISFADSDPDRLGLDVNLVLRRERDPTTPAAWTSCPRTGLKLQLWTEEPGLQIFNAATMQIAVAGHDGRSYGPFAGVCLEAQHFPNSLANPDWPSIIRTPENPYHQRLEVEIAPA